MKPTKFKKGDRVTAFTNYTRPDLRQEYVLAADVEKPEKWVTADVKTLGGRVTQVWSDSLRLVEPYTPQVGDKVRLVVEGVVKPLETGKFLVETEPGEGWRVYGKTDYTLELLEKAPEPKTYRVGTVVEGAEPNNGYAPLARTKTGKWYHLEANVLTGLTDKSVQQEIESGDRRVAYEPPTS